MARKKATRAVMKATAKSPANIAFIKYWGKTDPRTRIPQNNSISMCLSDLFSICTVEFKRGLEKDNIQFLNEKVVTNREEQRVVKVLDRVRGLGGVDFRARVVTKNNFPKATGIASSASGLSAVTLAAIGALGLDLEERELSKLCRMASGTACRSVPDGFVEWEKGINSEDSIAKTIFIPDWWDIADVVVIVTRKMKKVSSTEGHSLADTSPFYRARLAGMDEKVKAIKESIKRRDFSTFGRILEDDALNMHAVCFTSQPPIMYWEPLTIGIMKTVVEWRKFNDLESYFTIDAGPSVHVICRERDASVVVRRLRKVLGDQRVVINRPAVGARLVNKHLF